MSDDYIVINANSYEEAYEYALMQGWI